MASPIPQNMSQFSSGKPIAGFQKTRTGFWITISFALHVLLISALSYQYIFDTWIDPEGAKKRQLAEEEAKAAQAAALRDKPAAPKTASPTTAASPTAATSPTAPAASSAAPTAAASAAPVKPSNPEIPAGKENTPVVKSITATAKPGEIPKVPDDIGLSLDDTNIKK